MINTTTLKIWIFLLLVSCGNDGRSSGTLVSEFNMIRSGTFWNITANGVPLHTVDADSFVNKLRGQNYNLRIPTAPSPSGSTTQLTSEFPKAFGITLDGVKLDPLTAECYDISGSRSSANACTYRQDALQAIQGLGLDDFHGHVQPNGAYHYHAYSEEAAKLIYQKYTGSLPSASVDMVLIGLARDGYPIYYSLQNTYSSGYRLKSGINRIDFISKSSGGNPGLYVEDYEHTSSGTYILDECNGKNLGAPSDYASFNELTLDASINYFYVITKRLTSGTTANFPGISLCFKGSVNGSDGF